VIGERCCIVNGGGSIWVKDEQSRWVGISFDELTILAKLSPVYAMCVYLKDFEA
jgi:hypothetical protein